MKILIDMNLSPKWVDVFEREGMDAFHWSTVGDPRAADRIIMEWARVNDCVVFTHDLDFGTLLVTTHANGPSVIQIRVQDVMPRHLGNRMVQILREYEAKIRKGALITVDKARSRVRILPFPDNA
jgi:predicted nuclease of predicted toxin-antitoxin system